MGLGYAFEVLVLEFYSDFIAMLKGGLRTLGYPSADTAAADDVALRYYNLVRRLVEPIPRAILVAPDLTCPPSHVAGFDQLKKKIDDGTDVRPHLSRRLADLDYHDAFLNDWAIHHLHLGTVVEADGFVNRTGPLLYAKFERDAAYLIAIKSHGQWTNTDFVECLHTNWPDVIAGCKVPGISPTVLTAQQRGTLRRKHYNATVTTQDGTVYLPLGGGQMISGVATQVRIQADRMHMLVLEWQKRLVEHEDELREEAANMGIKPPDPWKLTLGFYEGDGVVLGDDGFALRLGPFG